MSSPTPGTRPMKVPMMPDRMIVAQCLSTVPILGITEPAASLTASYAGFFITQRISAKPNTPTNTGSRPKPPAKLMLP